MKLRVVPQGLIEGGSADITADPQTGVVTYSGTIDAGIGWFVKHFSDNGNLKLDPALLKSANLKLGQEFTFPAVHIQIVSLAEKSAAANVTISSSDKNFKGVAELDLSSEFWSIKHIVMSGTVSNEAVTLELTADFQ